MNFPFFSKKTTEGKTYLGIYLKEKEGIAFVMRMDRSRIILLDQEKFTYLNGWEYISEAVNQVIVNLEQRTKTKVQEAIFFLYSHFIDEKTKEINKAYLNQIKQLVKNLNLKALGYIECYEAIVHFIEKKENLPLTALLIELDHSNLSIFVYQRGGLIFNKVLAHTDNLIDDLMTSFSQIKGKFLLPSRIILYNSGDLDNAATDIVTYRWSEEVFVQLPRVEIINEPEIMQGLLGVFAEQINKNAGVIKATETPKKEEIMGFVIGGDVESKGEREPVQTILPATFPAVKFAPAKFFSSLKNPISEAVKTLTTINIRWTVILGIVLISGGLLINEYFFHKAELIVYLPFQSLKNELTIDSQGLKIEQVKLTGELKELKATTGKKEIGEKARGTVTIHNFEDNEKSFPKGTVLETGGLKYSLDQEVKVASASVITIEGGLVKQPGKVKASLTAEEIGSEANITGGKKFKIESLPDTLYFALNDSSFSGGSKKEIKTVTGKDQADLRTSLLDQAKKQDLDELIKSGQVQIKEGKIIRTLTEVELAEEKFDRELGEEADKLNLSAQAVTTVYYFQERNMLRILEKELSGKMKKGYNLQLENLSYSIKKAEKKNGEISLLLAIDARALKNIDKVKLLSQVRGRNKDTVERLIKNNFAAEGMKLDIAPKLPLFQSFTPWIGKNISLEISSL
ncbi:hypothetical protein A2774_01705 [Candidatus Roizmanbacteria bacterium RIFCSPHIGHO2_01_FULL_39_12c]|uniref:Baseplate protein J-like domain-containing protein n=1 Tax=Candidatus Roizmanbacteria bacterium RIFCSPHIGHO2_01_FULL_39_12c TaxID=1802031 RepID=A0A1F7GAZ8_9BACT|nr:MAG: hypothetical protein A2774_01705 [Candidatus Roizmanbacteria bacterium RIFCSPHIGHO2_01_FULL_39_12c]